MTEEQLFDAIGGIHEDLLQDSEKKRPHLRYVAGAAAACLAVAGCVWLWQGNFIRWNPGASDAQAPAAMKAKTEGTTALATDAAAEVPKKEPTTAGIGDREVSESIFFYQADALSQTETSIALPDGYFFEPMTAQTLGGLWGLEALETLDGYALTGEITYDGNGDAWSVQVTGTSETGEFSLELAPGHLPYTCCFAETEEYEQDYCGTTITALEVGDGCSLTGLYEGEEIVGLRASSSDKAILEKLAHMSFGPGGGLWLSQLHTDQIPAWRSEQLDEASARAEEGFGAYLPETVPERYTFRMAYREMGQKRDWLTMDYESGDYGYLELTVHKYHGDLPMIDPAAPETYDRRLYASGEQLPDEYWQTWSSGVFYREDLTEQTVAARCLTNDDGLEHCSLRVLYDDGTLVELTGWLSAGEAWELLRQLG